MSLEVDDWAEIKDLKTARAALTLLAEERRPTLKIKNLRYVTEDAKKWTELYCGNLVIRVYGRNAFRALFKELPDKHEKWLAEVEAWDDGILRQIIKGTLSQELRVQAQSYTKPKGNPGADYFIAEEGAITLGDIPF